MNPWIACWTGSDPDLHFDQGLEVDRDLVVDRVLDGLARRMPAADRTRRVVATKMVAAARAPATLDRQT